jgi:hypothetical protein
MAMTCSLPLLRKLKSLYNGDFLATSSVYEETVGRAARSLRFRYEGHRLKELIDDGIITIYSDKELSDKIANLANLINHTFYANGQPLTIVQKGEMSTLVASVEEKANTFAVDEKTARLLVEDALALKPWLEHKLHTKIKINSDIMKRWCSQIENKFIPLRSADFAMAAWSTGILGDDIDVLFSLLWALKFAGCAITEDEINFYMQKVKNK